jgi:hypothetical protein
MPVAALPCSNTTLMANRRASVSATPISRPSPRQSLIYLNATPSQRQQPTSERRSHHRPINRRPDHRPPTTDHRPPTTESVTIIGPKLADADAYATAVFVMGINGDHRM